MPAKVIRETVTQEDAPLESPTSRDETAVVTSGSNTAERIVYYIAGVIISILAIRFVLSLLGANRGNGFADFIYGVSYPFVAPFFGLFGYDVQYGVSRFEIETLFAMAIYALLAYGIVKMIRITRKEA